MKSRLLPIICILAITAQSVMASDIDKPQEQGFPVFSPAKPANNDNIQPKASTQKSRPSINTGIFALKQGEIPGYIHNKGYGVLDGIIYPQGQQYNGKLPIAKEHMHDPRTGIFLTQPPIGYILYRDTPDAQFFNRLLVDSNLNDTLGDEQPIPIADITKRTPINLHFAGEPIAFDLQFGKNGLKLYPKYWYIGSIKLQDTDYDAAIFKSTYGGEYNYGVVLLVDFNKDGEFTTSEYEYLTEAFLLQKQMVLKGKFYNGAISPNGKELTLEKMTTDFGQISFSLPANAAETANSYKFSFLPQGGSGRDILKIALDKLPVTLPAGKYGIIEGLVYDADFRVLLKFACPDFNIIKDKRLKLSLNTARMDALIRQDQEKIIAAQKTYGPRNIYYNLVGPANPKDPGPELLIFNTENPAEIYFKDHLEYG